MTPTPTHWGHGRIKWDTVTVAGATPSTDDDTFWLDGDDPTGTPFVAIADMSRRERVSATAKSLSSAGVTSRGMPLGRPGTLLFAMYASVGEVAFLDIQATWNQALLGITPDPDRVESRFLRYVFLNMRDDLLRDVRSNTQANLNASQVGDIWFQRPPIEEQRAIADYLDRETASINTFIEEQQHLIDMLRERRQNLIRAEVLGSINPFDAPNGALTAIAHHYSVTLGKMLDAGNKPRPGDVSLPYIRAGNIQDSGLRLDDVNEMPFSELEATSLDLRAGDLLVVEGGAVGTNVVVSEDMPGWSFQKTVNRLRPTGPACSSWLGYVLRTYRDIGVIDIVCNKSTIPHLTAEKLRALRVPNVEPKEQARIAALLDTETAKIDDLIIETQRFIELSRERRSALITAAVTGQIDVPAVA